MAIIMDGNGRWAEARSKPRHNGHRAGVESVRAAIEGCRKRNISVLTLFAFSSENWSRPKVEVTLLMNLFLASLKKELPNLLKNNIRLTVIGDVSAFSRKLQDSIKLVEAETAENNGLILQIAANYGGRWDVLQACSQLLRQRAQTGDVETPVSETELSNNLSFAELPDPDLFIRTGGERRISNFLLWQLSYTELYFTDILWPDFTDDELEKALQDFAKRQRRYGKTGKQVQKTEQKTSC